MIKKWFKRRSAIDPKPATIEDLGRQAVERARRDVEAFGWHLLMIGGTDSTAGFLFSIGLWQTYQHPEVILFAASREPQGMAARLQAVAERVKNGETFEAGKRYPEIFGKYPGILRKVQPQWYPEYLGTAGAFYESFDFPALQLFWPDGESRFPWESRFATDLFSFQPLLGEENVILANVGLATIQQMQAVSGQQLFPIALGEVFLRRRDTAKEGDLLKDWRWLVGPDLSLFQVTIFGDLMLKSLDGHIHWLDTGSAFHEEMGASEEEAIEKLCAYPAIFFHASTLLELRALDWKPSAGQVYSWRRPPMLGGPKTVDNLDLVDVSVHVSHAGRTAFAIKDLPEGAEISGIDFTPLG